MTRHPEKNKKKKRPATRNIDNNRCDCGAINGTRIYVALSIVVAVTSLYFFKFPNNSQLQQQQGLWKYSIKMCIWSFAHLLIAWRANKGVLLGILYPSVCLRAFHRGQQSRASNSSSEPATVPPPPPTETAVGRQ